MGLTKLALVGVGAVGSGVVQLLQQQQALIARHCGQQVVIARAVVRQPNKSRSVDLAGIPVGNDFSAVESDPEIQIVVELTGNVEFGFNYVARALASGKHVVTANKALLATRGAELFRLARQHQREILFEASVGGGIPIVSTIERSFVANPITRIRGILNGTTNFILSQMERAGSSYETALEKARQLGFAEADPTLDVNGTDTAQKLSILCRLGFGTDVPFDKISRWGIDQLDAMDMKYAKELKYSMKLLALASIHDKKLVARVAPTMIPFGHPLAQVSAEYNMIEVVGGATGPIYFEGRGAGSLPTASAVWSDIVDLITGRTQSTSRAVHRFSDDPNGVAFSPDDCVPSRFYLRFMIDDRPGTLAQISSVLGRHQVSIASVIQHDPGDAVGSSVPLIVMTHVADEVSLRRALVETDSLPVVRRKTVCYHVAE